MSTVEEIMAHARHLPLRDRLRLLGQLEAAIASDERPDAAAADQPSYAATVAVLGTMHSEHKDVSSDKYSHLGAIYASNSSAPPASASSEHQ